MFPEGKEMEHWLNGSRLCLLTNAKPAEYLKKWFHDEF